MRGRNLLALGVAVLSGCAEPALGEICPDAQAGDVVVTELRGPQSGPDTLPQWIELANAADHDLDLEGLHLVLTKLDGGSEREILVREGFELAPGERGVVAIGEPGDEHDYVDYRAAADFDVDLYSGGLLQVRGCSGETIDELVYRELPDEGTWSLDPEVGVDAEENDDEDNWCADAHEPEDGEIPGTEVGLPGTPGAPNSPCAEEDPP